MSAVKRAVMVVAILAGVFALGISVLSIRPAQSKSVVASCPLSNTIEALPLVRVRFGLCL